ncbi:MAG: Ig-like domain-containing protein [Dysgonamonadaceae bacterium]|jgi:N-acetylmuramoyl-L-alanine amidase|nr:Ig-like domain-containing protein [Dysgonamonadaceae bacterium]
MKKNLFLIGVLSLVCMFPAVAQDKATGLSNVKLFLDPGHALKENQGLYKYSEAEKTLRVAKAIREYLLTYTDMQEANIRLCREDDNTQVTLTERTDAANAWGANFFYSIHSDAGSSPTSANTTLIMYGGWRVDGVVYEKTPNGGKDYGEILTPNLSGAMRVGTRGNMADRTFYDGAQTHTNRYPYLHVNRESDMASLLSEGGFHTHYVQQARNLNAEWKRLEGYAAYQSLVKYLSSHYGTAAANPVQIGIATGFITDSETEVPVNGATITISDGLTGKNYTTDTYESLFHNYSSKPDELHNGFYFVEGLTPGATVNVTVEATGFQTQQTTLVIPATIGATTQDGLGVLDVQLLNVLPAVVGGIESENLTAVPINKPMILTFSRKMNRTSVESAISFAPAANVTYAWTNDYTLRIDISQLAFETDYTMTVDGNVAKNTVTDDFFDGDNDGTPGGNYVLNFKTGEQDVTPPTIVSYDPQSASDQEIALRPIVRIEFSEPLNEATIAPNQITVTDKNNETVGGTQHYTAINGKSVLHYFFTADLNPNGIYTVSLASGIEDLYGNEIENGLQYTFTARPRETTLTVVLDNFNTLAGTWWTPGASGSTTGIDTEATVRSISNAELATTASTGSLKFDYRWLETSASRLIRMHNTATTPKFSKDNYIQYYLFGDGSHTKFQVTLRNGGAGNFYAHAAIEMDWVGWRKITWDMANDPLEHPILGGTDDLPSGAVLNLSALVVTGAPSGYLSFLPSTFWVDELQVVQLSDFLGTAIPEVKSKDGINVTTIGKAIQVTAPDAINDIRIYSISGVLVKSVQPKQASFQIPTNDLTQGVYIVKVTTGTTQKNVKVIVK